MELRVEQMEGGYPGNRVLHGVSFTLAPGSFTVILGANGCGKTTLLKMILGLLPALGGRVCWKEQDLLTLRERERARILAYIPQVHRAPFAYRVKDVVRMGRTPHLNRLSMETPEDRAIAEESMDALGILPLEDRPYTALSGGQQQLVLIARALAQRAPFLLMDEPTSSLDFGNQYRVLEVVKSLTKRGLGVLMVTHDPGHVFFAADRVLVMQEGKLVFTGKPSELSVYLLSEIYRFPMFSGEVEWKGLCQRVLLPIKSEWNDERRKV